MKTDQDYILLILNCNKYRNKADFQKSTWIRSLNKDILYFHVIGDPSIKNPVFDYENHILYVSSKDDYCSLPDKVIKAIKAIDNTYNYKYIFKTDDDQILVNSKFFNVVMTSINLKNYDYGGKNVKVNDHYSTYYTVHSELPKKLFLKACTYCNGRFYFLSKKIVNILLQHEEFISKQVIEDHTIGYVIQEYANSPLITSIDSDKYLVDKEKYLENYYHIFTECVNCPELAYSALKSFSYFHRDLIVNVYLTNADLDYFKQNKKELLESKNIKFILVDDKLIKIYHQSGHLGTAILWTNVINEFRNTIKKVIHFDSDVIFTGDVVYDIIYSLVIGNDLVGPIRSYKNNHNGREDIKYLSDVCSTYCFGFNPNKVSDFDYDTLVSMVRGFHNPLNHPILDFFDPVSFDILKNGGKISYIDYNTIGNMDINGSKSNKYTKINNIFDVGDKIMHFSAIGSGINYLKLKSKGLQTQVPLSYIEAGLRSYNIYNYLVYNKPLEITDRNIKETVEEFKPIFIGKIKDIEI